MEAFLPNDFDDDRKINWHSLSEFFIAIECIEKSSQAI
jgi:hypothetical protein